MGKTTLLYLSISEAFIPNNLSGGGPTGPGAGGAGEQPKIIFDKKYTKHQFENCKKAHIIRKSQCIGLGQRQENRKMEMFVCQVSSTLWNKYIHQRFMVDKD